MMIIKGHCDKGFNIPVMGSSSFINNPMNIKNAMLNPTERKTVSVKERSRNLNSFKITIPGRKVKERKPKTCLATVRSRIMVTHVTICMAMTTTSKFPNFESPVCKGFTFPS